MAEIDPFESPKLLLANAEENLGRLHDKVGAFWDTKPYARVTDKDPHTGWDVHKIRLTGKIPGSVSATYANILSDLRHSLDQSVCAASRALGVMALEDMYFPIAGSEDQLAGAIKSRCKNVPRELIPFLEGLKPYKRPNGFLWTVSKLAGTNKHQMLTAMLVDTANGAVGINSAVGFGVDWVPDGRWDAAKNEMAIAMVRPGAKPNYNVSIRLQISLGENDALLRGPALPLLGFMFGEVAKAVAGIEAETNRILKERDG